MTHEFIVQFEPDVDEASARKVVGDLGATVRRRMRNDSGVMLLVRGNKDLAAKLEQASTVKHVEPNHGGYVPMD